MIILLQLVDFLFTLMTFAIIGRAILSWFPQDPFNPSPIAVLLNRITDPILEPIRRFIPSIGMMDITPIVALVILQVLQAIIDNFLSGLM
jgi:YggT family protein